MSYHIPKQLLLGLNCFKPERMHKELKQLALHAGNAPGPKREAYIQKRLLAHSLPTLSSGTMFEEYFMVQPQPEPMLRHSLQLLEPMVGEQVHTSKEMACGSVGTVRQNSLVVLSCVNKEIKLGMVVCFVRCDCRGSGRLLHFVRCLNFSKIGELEWAPSCGDLSFYPVEDLQFVIPYLQRDNRIVIPLLPGVGTRCA